MIKVRILDRCEFCDGEAYVFVSEDVVNEDALLIFRIYDGSIFNSHQDRECRINCVNGLSYKTLNKRKIYDTQK